MLEVIDHDGTIDKSNLDFAIKQPVKRKPEWNYHMFAFHTMIKA